MNENATLQPITDPAAWSGSEVASSSEWRYELTTTEIADLQQMAANIRPQLQDDPNRLMALPTAHFNLGAFTPRAEALYTGLKQGLGIGLIRGLPVTDMDPIDVASVYWGIGLHLGHATPNNPDGDMLGHITDLGKSQRDPNSRGYQTREAMDYHCDQADMVGLICIRTAQTGGVSKVASSVHMYNELLRLHPEHAAALTQPLCWSKHGEHAADEQPHYESPVFNFLDDTFRVSFGPKHIIKGHDLPTTPPLTDVQREAIQKAEDIADANRFDMVLEPGDMQFLNNYVVLHTRSAYEDHTDPALKRLLWRLWLVNEDLRPRTAYTTQFQHGVQLGGRHHQIRLS